MVHVPVVSLLHVVHNYELVIFHFSYLSFYFQTPVSYSTYNKNEAVVPILFFFFASDTWA